MLLVPDNLLTPSNHEAPTSQDCVSFTLQQVDELNQFIMHGTTPAEIDRVRLIFWSSRDSQTGQMWCPDCSEMEINLSNVLKYLALDSITTPGKDHASSAQEDSVQAQQRSSAPFLVYIYVGDRHEWRSSDNPFRQLPWSLSKIPTVLKLRNQPSDNLKNEVILNHDDKLVEEESLDFKRLLDFLS
ncbi:hypothetical protein PCANC_05544 [Puccinia coronata f. sp. avenae]|uniref:Thioredoxin domain-containing protein n=1 Tax=Puccinia coronata f. sp. avenae TaxID=200324 RepID=A0A2N5VJK7_9BASI|nr:hypothetical protein PCASD_16656 [Puccinia coronata f. sp. avenae]PLW12493.1 hypothetical protein PCANC_16569 [Puccinia coronata f. sp. avenae]PLW50162.1 hypothetical protein PCASD_01848 [Puccinia coronata f. sp. avenae]PLW51761.1 hypothetical protein PCANC_05544 [Puccinia coronata f. sp. avenae]